MVWEFPAISQSQIEFWGKPQYTQRGLLIFTLLFGAVGLHHLYLRSPQSFVMFLIGNTLTLGYWYWYDLAQIYTSSPENLNKYGITTPLKEMAIARGMFRCGEKEGEETKAQKDDPPNPLWFVLYCLLLPFPYLSNLVSGDYVMALTSFFWLLIPILGLFILFSLSAFGFIELLAKPGSVLYNGSSRIFPFTLFGYEKDGQSSRLMSPLREEAEEAEEPKGLLVSILNFLSSSFQAFVVAAMPFLQFVVPPPILASLGSVATTAKVAMNTATKVVDITEQKVIPMAEETLEKGMAIAEKGADAAVKVGRLAEEVPKTIAATLGSLPKIPGVPGIQRGGALPEASFQEQSSSSKTPGDWMALGVIGAVAASGFLLTAGRSFKDALQHFRNPGDTPPQKP